MWEMLKVVGDSQISPVVIMVKIKMVVVQTMEEVGERYLHATIVGNWGISAHSVTSHRGWEEICILYLRSCQIVQMIMGLRSEGKQGQVG